MSYMDLQDNGFLSFSPIGDFEHYDGAPPSYDIPQYSPEITQQSQHQQQQQYQPQQPQQELAAHDAKKMMKKLQNELDYQAQLDHMGSGAPPSNVSGMPHSAPAAASAAATFSMPHPSDFNGPYVRQASTRPTTTVEGFSAALDGGMMDADDGPGAAGSGVGGGYFSEVWDRRRSVLKLMVITLVILLAISLHNTIYFYICALIDRIKHRPRWNEVVIRIAYPIVILLAMWHLKAYVVGGGSSV